MRNLVSILIVFFIPYWTYSQNLNFELFNQYNVFSPGASVPIPADKGFSVSAPIGDLDGDGIPDIITSAVSDEEASLYVLFLNIDGSIKNYTKIADGEGGFVGNGNTVSNYFGCDIDTIGDLNGDGNIDIVVGADFEQNNDDQSCGAIYILFLNSDGTVLANQKIGYETGGLKKLQKFSSFGSSVALAGDLDDDNVPDLYVSAPGDSSVLSNSGAIYILYLNSNGTVKSQEKILPTIPGIEVGFGSYLATVGDIDLNGVVDIVVGNKSRQLATVFLNPDGTIKKSKLIDTTHAIFGPITSKYDGHISSVSSLSDIDNNGVSDILFGSKYGSSATSYKGAVFVGFLDEEGDIVAIETIDSAALPVLGNISQSYFGSELSYLGDIDGDEYPEIGIGEGRTGAPFNPGTVHIISLKPKLCSSECVWPGDANNDGAANGKDLMNIGMNWQKNSTNTTRILPTTNWVGQIAKPWLQSEYGVNLKYSDSNGDDIIDNDDIQAISDNYNSTHNKMAGFVELDPNGPLLSIVASKDTLRAGDSVYFDISLGEPSKQAEDVYAVSMELRHSVSEIFGATTNTADFSTCWLGTDGLDLITLPFAQPDGIDISMSRNDFTNRTGDGLLARVKVVMPDNLGGDMAKDLSLDLTDLLIISYQQDTIKPNFETDTVLVFNEKGRSIEDLNQDGLILYPNPAKNVLRIESNELIHSIQIFDITGRLVKSEKFNSTDHQIFIDDINNGTYMVTVDFENHRTVKKIEIFK